MMKKTSLGTFLCLSLMVLYFTFVNKREAVSASPKRMVASVPKERILKPIESAPHVQPVVEINKPVEAVKEIDRATQKQESVKQVIQNIRSMLHPETLDWGQRLPAPSNSAEEVLFWRLHLVYQIRNSSTMKSLLPVSRGKPMEDSTVSYLETCIRTMNPYEDYKLKNYLLLYAREKNPRHDVSTLVQEQTDIFFRYSDAYDQDDYDDLRDIVANTLSFENEHKNRMLEELQQWQELKNLSDEQ